MIEFPLHVLVFQITLSPQVWAMCNCPNHFNLWRLDIILINPSRWRDFRKPFRAWLWVTTLTNPWINGALEMVSKKGATKTGPWICMVHIKWCRWHYTSIQVQKKVLTYMISSWWSWHCMVVQFVSFDFFWHIFFVDILGVMPRVDSSQMFKPAGWHVEKVLVERLRWSW